MERAASAASVVRSVPGGGRGLPRKGVYVAFAPFGIADEIRSVIKRLKLPARLYVIEGGDHSFNKIPRSSGVPQAQVYEDIFNEWAVVTREMSACRRLHKRCVTAW